LSLKQILELMEP